MISLKNQVTLFLAFFVAVLVMQLFYANVNQNTLVDSFSDYRSASNEEKLVKELERDVLDLQRYVLVFNDTGHNSSIERFELLHSEIIGVLEQLYQNLPVDLRNQQTDDTIQAMLLHIHDYKINFENAQQSRYQRDSLLNDGVLSSINTLMDRAQTDFEGSSETLSKINTAKHIAQYRLHLSLAENFLFQYLSKPSFELQNSYLAAMDEAKLLADKTVQGNVTAIHEDLDTIKEQFLKLTHLTQGYLFLVNVVMAGSANEFLYLAQELSQATQDYSLKTNQEINDTIVDSQQKMYISSLLGILLTLIIGFFTAYRIIRPIKEITHAFGLLIEDKEIEAIPGIHRKDEIGKLAKAARVFKSNIVQTRFLLKNAQQLNESQASLNQKLEDAIVVAENANRSKSIFLANMSHEIRTPMNGIIGLVDLSLHQELTSQVRGNLEKVAYSSQILMNVINDILDFSKIEAGKLQIENNFFSFASLFDSLLAVISLRAAEKNLNLQLYVNPDLPTNALGDQLRISQVILNLCSNAIKFTNSGTVTINVNWQAHASSSSEFILKVDIIDSGIGISDEQLQSIFEPFTQADGSTSRKYGGSGLGLAIVGQLTKLMQGEVSASSTLGVGSKFTCTFRLGHEVEPHPLMKAENSYQKHIIYVSDCATPLTPSDYLERISTTVEMCTYADFIASEGRYDNDKIILIDVENGKLARPVYPVIQALKQAKVMFGGITNTQPDQLAKILSEQWSCPMLAHPFSPTEFYLFTNALYQQDSLFSSRENPSIVDSTKTSINNEQYHGHVLLVEDNSINQIVAGEMLHSFGLTYDIAEDGQQALTKVKNSPYYDLILMDIQMPILDGYQATQAIRKLNMADLAEVPILGLSANAMKQDFEKAEASGMNEYLTKPIRRETLRKTIERYLPRAT